MAMQQRAEDKKAKMVEVVGLPVKKTCMKKNKSKAKTEMQTLLLLQSACNEMEQQNKLLNALIAQLS